MTNYNFIISWLCMMKLLRLGESGLPSKLKTRLAFSQEQPKKGSKMIILNNAELRKVCHSPSVSTIYRSGVEKLKYTIVCLCGSTRFVEDFNFWRKELTLRGEIVLSIEIVTTQKEDEDPQKVDPQVKVELDRLHLAKIDLADYIFVINRRGYVGDSTRREISYAYRNNKPIRFMEATINDFHDLDKDPVCPRCESGSHIDTDPTKWGAEVYCTRCTISFHPGE